MRDAAPLLLATLRLRRTGASDELREAWRTVDSAGLAHLVAFEGCPLWLYRRLKELDVVRDLDPGLAQWLTLRARQTTTRNLLVDAQRDALIQILNDLAVPHVMLKGAARRLVAHRYPYADARATSDVDVLLPPHLARPTWERLRRLGFRPGTHRPQMYESHIHLPPLRNGRNVAVELHTSTSLAVPPDVAWRRLAGTAGPVRAGATATRVPAATELFWHAVTHAPLRWPDAFRLRFLQDAAVVWATGEEIDWGEIVARFGGGEVTHVGPARAWLGAAAWLAGSPQIDRRLGVGGAFDLARALQWRLGVLRRWAPAGVPARAATDRAPRMRLCRLLMAEGTRIELGLGPTPQPAGTRVLPAFGRRILAGVARLCYHAWLTLAGGRSPQPATTPVPGTAP